MTPPLEPQDDDPGGSRPRPPGAAVVLAVIGILLSAIVIGIARHSPGPTSPGQPSVHATAPPLPAAPAAGQEPALTNDCATAGAASSGATRAGDSSSPAAPPARDGPRVLPACQRPNRVLP